MGCIQANMIPESKASLDFGINFVDCAADYFRPNAAWPLQGSSTIADFGTTVRLCQNRHEEDHKYATLFSVTERIPVYSAIKIKRDPNESSNSRPNSNWHHVALGLCLVYKYYQHVILCYKQPISNFNQSYPFLDYIGFPTQIT